MQQNLTDIIGDTNKVKQVLALLAETDTMKKYLKTPRGIEAKKRANIRYQETLKKKEKAKVIDVEVQLREWGFEQESGHPEYDESDADEHQMQPVFIRYVSIGELWQDYNHRYNESITRIRYGQAILKECPEASECLSEGKLRFNIAFELRVWH